jgi:Type II CAAX prenyl endopeptidase Rce1-like
VSQVVRLVVAGAFPSFVMLGLICYSFHPFLAMGIMHFGMLGFISFESLTGLLAVFTPRFHFIHLGFFCLTVILGLAIHYLIVKPIYSVELLEFKNLINSSDQKLTFILASIYLVTLNPLIEESFWRRYLLPGIKSDSEVAACEVTTGEEVSPGEQGSLLQTNSQRQSKKESNLGYLVNSVLWYSMYHCVIFLSRISWKFAIAGFVSLCCLGWILAELSRRESGDVGGAVSIHAAVDLVMVIALWLL